MKLTLVFAAALLSIGSAQATQEHETPAPVRPVKTVKARASSSSASQIGITNTVGAPSATFGGTSALGGSVSGAGNAYVNSERSAPPVAVAAPQQPITSCRLGFGVGGSNTSGGLGLNFVAGQDQLCLVSAQLALMDRIGQFTELDRLTVVCKVEGMSETSRCKGMKQEPALATYKDGNLLP